MTNGLSLRRERVNYFSEVKERPGAAKGLKPISIGLLTLLPLDFAAIVNCICRSALMTLALQVGLSSVGLCAGGRLRQTIAGRRRY